MPDPTPPVRRLSLRRRPALTGLATIALVAACDDAGGHFPVGGDGGPTADGAPADATPPDAAQWVGPPPLCEVTIDCGAAIPNEPKITCAARIEDGVGGVAYQGEIGIERRGRSSLGFAKPQYSIELRDALGAERPANLFGMGAESDWVLNGMYIDRALLRNKLVFDMFQSLGGPERYAPESRYCTLVLDDDWRGVYALAESVKRDDDRVVLGDEGGVGLSFIVKQDDSAGFRSIGIANGVWQLVYPRQAIASDAQKAGVSSWLQGWQDAVTGAVGAADLFELVDLDSAVDFVLFEELLKNVDSFYLSMHIAKDVGGKARWVPWDVDLSFGQPLYGGATMTTGWIQYRPAMVQKMALDPRFAERLVERWAELRADLFTPAAIQARIDDLITTVAPALADNFTRWPIEDIQFLDEQLPERASHAEELAVIAAWIDARVLWIDANVAAYAAGNPPP